MLLVFGKYLIDCPYLGIMRCDAPPNLWTDAFFYNKDWEPLYCKDCIQCRSWQELKEAKLNDDILRVKAMLPIQKQAFKVANDKNITKL